MTQRELTVQLYTPHAGQLRLHNSRARFRVACWGRQAGKTFGCCNEFVKRGIERRKSLNWWIAPTYRQGENAFKTIIEAMRSQMTAKPNYTKLSFKLFHSEFEFRSAERPDNLRGDSPHYMTLDECRDIPMRAWFEVLMPMLSATDGEATFISTPRGHDWFYQLYQKGQDPLEREYDSFSLPSMINPYVSREFIAEMRRTLPEDMFAQEILAEFLEDAATVFKRVDSCISGDFEEPIPGHTYILGWDPAKHQDFSVIIILDCNTGHVVWMDRDNRTDYRIQLLRVIALAHKYNGATVIMDATGVGDPLLEQLRAADLVVEGFVFTNASKKELVERLQIAIEHHQISYPRCEVLLQELKAFGYTITASRNVVYSAPEGQHDDVVMALGLAVYGAKLGSEIAIVRSLGYSSAGVPAPHRFDDVDLDGHLSEDQRQDIDRRQAMTGRVLSDLLNGRFGLR